MSNYLEKETEMTDAAPAKNTVRTELREMCDIYFWQCALEAALAAHLPWVTALAWSKEAAAAAALIFDKRWQQTQNFSKLCQAVISKRCDFQKDSP